MNFARVDQSSFSFRSDVDRLKSTTHRSGIIHALRTTKSNRSDNDRIILRGEQTFIWVADVENNAALVAVSAYLKSHGYNPAGDGKATEEGSAVRFVPYTSREAWCYSYPHAVPELECTEDGRLAVTMGGGVGRRAATAPAAMGRRGASGLQPAVADILPSASAPQACGGPNAMGDRMRYLTDEQRNELHVQIYNYLYWLLLKVASFQSGRQEADTGTAGENGEPDGGDDDFVNKDDGDDLGRYLDTPFSSRETSSWFDSVDAGKLEGALLKFMGAFSNIAARVTPFNKEKTTVAGSPEAGGGEEQKPLLEDALSEQLTNLVRLREVRRRQLAKKRKRTEVLAQIRQRRQKRDNEAAAAGGRHERVSEEFSRLLSKVENYKRVYGDAVCLSPAQADAVDQLLSSYRIFEHPDGVRRRMPSDWTFNKIALPAMYVYWHCGNEITEMAPVKMWDKGDFEGPEAKRRMGERSDLKRAMKLLDEGATKNGFPPRKFMTYVEAIECYEAAKGGLLNLVCMRETKKGRQRKNIDKMSWKSLNTIAFRRNLENCQAESERADAAFGIGSRFDLFEHPDGLMRRFPPDFTLSKLTIREVYEMWHCGNAERRVPPIKTWNASDYHAFRTMKGMPLSNIKEVVAFMDNAAREDGLDTEPILTSKEMERCFNVGIERMKEVLTCDPSDKKIKELAMSSFWTLAKDLKRVNQSTSAGSKEPSTADAVGQLPSSYRIFEHPDGARRLMPPDWTFNKIALPAMYIYWHCGDEQTKMAPVKMWDTGDFEGLKAKRRTTERSELNRLMKFLDEEATKNGSSPRKFMTYAEATKCYEAAKGGLLNMAGVRETKQGRQRKNLDKMQWNTLNTIIFSKKNVAILENCQAESERADAAFGIGSRFDLFEHPDGAMRRVPPDFTLSKLTIREVYALWHCGDAERRVSPIKTWKISDHQAFWAMKGLNTIELKRVVAFLDNAAREDGLDTEPILTGEEMEKCFNVGMERMKEVIPFDPFGKKNKKLTTFSFGTLARELMKVNKLPLLRPKKSST